MEELLADAKPENHFITRDGRRIKNLYQLHKSLLNMDDDTFNHHVNQERNDFYNWVRDVFKDNALESTMLKCKTKNELAQRIKEKLNHAVREKKEQDVRTIIKEAKQEVDEKLKEQKEIEKQVKKIESRPLKKKVEHKKIEKNEAAKKKVAEKPEKKEVKQERKIEHVRKEVREDIEKHHPKKEEHVFVPKPPRTFSKEERPVSIKSISYMKASLIDFVFGIIIGVIAILILKQLL